MLNLTDLLKRRDAIRKALAWSGLLFSYGTLAAFAGRFLYPSGLKRKRKMYLSSLSNIPVGKATTVSTPTGGKIILANTEKGLQAFSSRCPHLGCQVLWRDNDRDFFCPCHNGRFNSEGTAIEGPPAKEGTDLNPVKIKVEGDSIFAWV